MFLTLAQRIYLNTKENNHVTHTWGNGIRKVWELTLTIVNLYFNFWGIEVAWWSTFVDFRMESELKSLKKNKRCLFPLPNSKNQAIWRASHWEVWSLSRTFLDDVLNGIHKKEHRRNKHNLSGERSKTGDTVTKTVKTTALARQPCKGSIATTSHRLPESSDGMHNALFITLYLLLRFS